MSQSTSKKRRKNNSMNSRQNDCRQLIQALVERKFITEKDAQALHSEFKGSSGSDSLENFLIDSKYVTEEQILETKASLWNIPYISLKNQIIDAEVLKIVPLELAKANTIFPLFCIRDKLFIAMADPHNVEIIDRINQHTTRTIAPTLASPQEIKMAISRYYEKGQSDFLSSSDEDLHDILEIIEASREDTEEEIPVHELQKMTQEAPVVRVTNLILNQAIKDRASDVHISPKENQLNVSMRVDGILKNSFNLPKYLQPAVISRIKILSNIDIAEHRLPQDGKIWMRLKSGEKVDIRVSTFPVNHGEDVVLRILRKDPSLLNLENLGFEEDVLRTVLQLFDSTYGIVLITGPTGSGKTTTLYAALNRLANGEKNIMTLEDPIEYDFPFIRQSQVNEKAGMTFARGIRSILRHDPDIIMVGEIRDAATATIAIQAAMTGHLVLSTLHTTDSSGAVLRLIDHLGVNPFLLSSALVGVMAERLVRKVCSHCKEPYQPALKIPKNFLKEMFDEEDLHSIKYYKGTGCKYCHGTGYRGRIALMEVLVINKSIRELIANTVSIEQLKQTAISNGMRPLLQDGWIKVLKGITTLEEVVRVTNIE